MKINRNKTETFFNFLYQVELKQMSNLSDRQRWWFYKVSHQLYNRYKVLIQSK